MCNYDVSVETLYDHQKKTDWLTFIFFHTPSKSFTAQFRMGHVCTTCTWSSDWLVFGCLASATDQLRSLQMEEQMNISGQIFGTGRVDEDILGPPNQRSSSPQQ